MYHVLDPPVFSGEGREKSECLCLAPTEIAFWCTAGNPLGEKLMGAFNSCFNAEEEEEDGKGKSKRAAGDICPSVDEVEAWFGCIVHTGLLQ